MRPWSLNRQDRPRQRRLLGSSERTVKGFIYGEWYTWGERPIRHVQGARRRTRGRTISRED